MPFLTCFDRDVFVVLNAPLSDFIAHNAPLNTKSKRPRYKSFLPEKKVLMSEL